MTFIIGSLNCLYVYKDECSIDSSEPYFFSAFPPVLHFCNERLLFKDSSHVTDAKTITRYSYVAGV